MPRNQKNQNLRKNWINDFAKNAIWGHTWNHISVFSQFFDFHHNFLDLIKQLKQGYSYKIGQKARFLASVSENASLLKQTRKHYLVLEFWNLEDEISVWVRNWELKTQVLNPMKIEFENPNPGLLTND